MKKGLLVILSAPSGAGKSTIAKQLIARGQHLDFSVSATTRKPRTGEVDGRDYYFISETEFKQKIESDAFIEWAQVHNNYYGTLYSELERMWNVGKDVLLDIDVQGGMQLRKNNVRGLFIFVAPPSLKVLEERLRGRGTDCDATIELRLNNARQEMEFQPHYDQVVINDDLERAIAEVQQIINNARNNA